MRVEAGINRLLLPCPARLRPADTGSNRWTPQSIGDGPVLAAQGALACARRVGLAMRKPA
jgi:hypothetical protein